MNKSLLQRFGEGPLYSATVILLFLIAWQLVAVGLDIPGHLLPPPTRILFGLVANFSILGKDILTTSYEMLLGLGLCIIVSVPLSVLIVWIPAFDKAFMPLLVISQTVPVIAIVPVLIIWFGVGILPKIIIVFLLGFFQLVLLTVSGLNSIEPGMIDLMRSMSASTKDIFLKARMPAALPYIFDGVKLAALLSVIGAVVAEIVASDYGLGHVIVYAISEMNGEMLFGALFLLSAMGGILFSLISYLERIFLHWHVAMRRDLQIRDVG